MSARDRHTLQTEPTQGQQKLIPGVRPLTTRDRLALLADAPARGAKAARYRAVR
ncbi:hypothetical protein [Mesorhizobium sp. STM 4661]|uniref:hypothetical protein n=1 Tax=Mesorhizobium sp. STM 4661 TaxID=1297570 RepID=UPI0002BF5C06|nr:hypothetical protein [Mesorhizobium sp. STM 4661]CCV11490.1 hypothetical protein MESS4_330039 [Mesorhizobium sp. STM 4661]